MKYYINKNTDFAPHKKKTKDVFDRLDKLIDRLETLNLQTVDAIGSYCKSQIDILSN